MTLYTLFLLSYLVKDKLSLLNAIVKILSDRMAVLQTDRVLSSTWLGHTLFERGMAYISQSNSLATPIMSVFGFWSFQVFTKKTKNSKTQKTTNKNNQLKTKKSNKKTRTKTQNKETNKTNLFAYESSIGLKPWNCTAPMSHCIKRMIINKQKIIMKNRHNQINKKK